MDQIGSRDRFSLSLSFVDVTVDPDLVTERLGVEPTRSFKKGDRFPGKSNEYRKHGGWILESELPLTSSFEDHFSWLISKIVGREEDIEYLTSHGYRPVLYVGYFFNRKEDGQIELNSQVVQKIASLRLNIDIRTYCMNDEQSESE
jgi:hypothetical protein